MLTAVCAPQRRQCCAGNWRIYILHFVAVIVTPSCLIVAYKIFITNLYWNQAASSLLENIHSKVCRTVTRQRQPQAVEYNSNIRQTVSRLTAVNCQFLTLAFAINSDYLSTVDISPGV